MPRRDTAENAPYVVSKIHLRHAPQKAVDIMELLIDEALKSWETHHSIMPWNEYFAMVLPKKIIESQKERAKQKGPLRGMLRDFRPTSVRDRVRMCTDCSGFIDPSGPQLSLKERVLLDKLGNHSVRIGHALGNCPSASLLWGSRESRNPEIVADRIYGHKIEENERMRDGTRGHEILEVRRDLVRDVDELVRGLMKGGWVAWALPICRPLGPMRANPPDAVYSKLEKTQTGWHITHIIIEDKPHTDRLDYQRQADGEGMIMQYSHWLLHSNVIKAEFHKTPAVPFNSMLAQKLGLSDLSGLSVDIYVAMNGYVDWRNPVDNYSYILKGEPIPEGVTPPKHWSKDGKADVENRDAEYWVWRAKQSIDDAIYGAWMKELAKITPADIEAYRLHHPGEPDEVEPKGSLLNLRGNRVRELVRETEE